MKKLIKLIEYFLQVTCGRKKVQQHCVVIIALLYKIAGQKIKQVVSLVRWSPKIFHQRKKKKKENRSHTRKVLVASKFPAHHLYAGIFITIFLFSRLTLSSQWPTNNSPYGTFKGFIITEELYLNRSMVWKIRWQKQLFHDRTRYKIIYLG